MDPAEVEVWRKRMSESVASGTPVAVAIEREEWELAALHLLVNAAEMLEELGPEACEALMDELDPGPAPHRGSRARKRRGGRGG